MKSGLHLLFDPKRRIVPHILFWVCYIIFFTLLQGSFEEKYLRAFVHVLSTLPVRMAVTYFTLYILMPRFLYAQRPVAFLLSFALTAIFFAYLDRLSLHVYYVPVYRPDYNYEKYPLTHFGKAIGRLIPLCTVILAAVVAKLLKRNYQNEKLAQELSRARLDAELKFLKAQIHPHFLFNTLNNLYALTLQNSPKSSETVLRLSNLLDYMLYECNGKRIPLRKEIQQIRNFIELEKLRYGNRLFVDFSTGGDLMGLQVPPLLILPFIENAFKHGVSNNIEESFISIDLRLQGETVVLKVENSKSDEKPLPAQKKANYKEGIGLRNVKRRLELIYDQRSQLQILEEEETFLIILRIPAEPLHTEATPSKAALEPQVPEGKTT